MYLWNYEKSVLDLVSEMERKKSKKYHETSQDLLNTRRLRNSFSFQ